MKFKVSQNLLHEGHCKYSWYCNWCICKCFFIQNGSEPGQEFTFIAAPASQMGDSVIVVGEVSEFCWDDGIM